MRTISKSSIFYLRYGTQFSLVSLLLIVIGIAVFIQSIFKNINNLPLAVAFLMVGPMLLFVSVVRSNNKIKLIMTGNHSRGKYKEWKNSFMIRNNSTLVFLIYTYYDKRGKLKETAVLSSNMNAREEVNIFYNEDDSVVLEYLPGSPWMKSYNEIVR